MEIFLTCSRAKCTRLGSADESYVGYLASNADRVQRLHTFDAYLPIHDIDIRKKASITISDSIRAALVK